MPHIEVIGLDGDDTLWHNEPLFTMTHQRFAALLADLADADKLGERLDEIQRVNLAHYGYGAKAEDSGPRPEPAEAPGLAPQPH